MCAYVCVYKTNTHGGYVFPGKVKITFAQKKITISSVQYQVKLHSCSVFHKELQNIHYGRIAEINLPLLLRILRSEDQRPGPLKPIQIKTEIVEGWEGLPRKITSSFLVQSTATKNLTLFRFLLIHYLFQVRSRML